VASTLGYVTNWWLIADHQSYFVSTARPSMLQHLWSLAIEEQFYVVWSLVVMAVAGVLLVRQRGLVGTAGALFQAAHVQQAAGAAVPDRRGCALSGALGQQARVQVTPALDMEQLFETTVALAEEGATNRKGMPKPLHLALFVRRFRREVRAPFPPAPIVGALLAPLAWTATKRGHGRRYGIGDVVAESAPRTVTA